MVTQEHTSWTSSVSLRSSSSPADHHVLAPQSYCEGPSALPFQVIISATSLASCRRLEASMSTIMEGSAAAYRLPVQQLELIGSSASAP